MRHGRCDDLDAAGDLATAREHRAGEAQYRDDEHDGRREQDAENLRRPGHAASSGLVRHCTDASGQRLGPGAEHGPKGPRARDPSIDQG